MKQNVDECVSEVDVSVVVLSYNRKSELESNLPQILDLSTRLSLQFIVVDNASSDGSREYLLSLQEKYSSLRLVLNDSNLGVAKGREAGWSLSSRKYILNIDDDTSIEGEDIAELCKFMNTNPKVGALSPRIVHAKTGESQCDHGENCQSIANFHGACHVVRRDVYEKVGPLDHLCSFGGEELDYSIRIRNEGYDVVYAPVTTVRHNNYRRTGAEGVWRRKQWVYNFTRVLYKHFPFSMATIQAFRYLVSHIWSATKAEGVLSGLSLIPSYIKGAADGRSHYCKIHDTVRKFYADPNLRPEAGNVPLIKKLIRF